MTDFRDENQSAGLPAGTGQLVRIKHDSKIAIGLNLPDEALGTVMCRYRLLGKRIVSPERLDVRFDAQTVFWGCPAEAFETVDDGSATLDINAIG